MLMPPFRLQVMPHPQTPLQAALWACAGSLGLVFAYSCSYNLLLFAPALYLLQIYDRVLSSRSADTLLMLTLIVALTVAVGACLMHCVAPYWAGLEHGLKIASVRKCSPYASTMPFAQIRCVHRRYIGI